MATLTAAIPHHAGTGFSDAAAAYRAQARRLRGRFRGQTGTLQHALRELARDTDRTTGTPPPARCPAPSKRPSPFSAVLGIPDISADLLLRQIEDSIQAGTLDFRNRQAIYATARRLGTSRFHANLLIAACQHRYELDGQSEEPSRSPAWTVLTMALVAELLVIAGALGVWQLWR